MGILQDEVEGDVGAVPVCQTCGSERVAKDAWACWNPETGLWELWKRSEAPPQNRIRELNDAFRMKGEGKGSIMVTVGVQALGDTLTKEAMLAVKEFSDFSKDNDPWGEHDFGAVEIGGQKIFWKLDYYDPSLTAGSENPANEAVTHRVLTIMLASEY